MEELEGFEVFKPDEYKKIFLTPWKKSVGICSEAYKALGSPDYLNFFIDEAGKRILVKKAEKNYANALHVVNHSGGHNMNICCKTLAEKISELHGKSKRIFGHVVSEGMIIFDKS